MKICFKCHAEKALREYYRHPAMGDGRLGKCKACTKKDVLEHRLKNLERIKAYDRARGNRQTIEEQRRLRKEYNKKFPMAVLAHRIVVKAKRKGLVIPKPCEVCGNQRSHGHHEDYLRPLELKWLCSIHHVQRHSEMKKEGIDTHATMKP